MALIRQQLSDDDDRIGVKPHVLWCGACDERTVYITYTAYIRIPLSSLSLSLSHSTCPPFSASISSLRYAPYMARQPEVYQVIIEAVSAMQQKMVEDADEGESKRESKKGGDARNTKGNGNGAGVRRRPGVPGESKRDGRDGRNGKAAGQGGNRQQRSTDRRGGTRASSEMSGGQKGERKGEQKEEQVARRLFDETAAAAAGVMHEAGRGGKHGEVVSNVKRRGGILYQPGFLVALVFMCAGFVMVLMFASRLDGLHKKLLAGALPTTIGDGGSGCLCEPPTPVEECACG